MGELFSARRHLARIRLAAFAVACLGIAAAPRQASLWLLLLWAGGLAATQVLFVAVHRYRPYELLTRLAVYSDLAFLLVACMLSSADLFWLLLFPLVSAVRLLHPRDVSVMVVAALGAHAAMQPAPFSSWEGVVELLLRAAALGLAAAAAWALALSERAARPRWSVVRDAIRPPPARDSAMALRYRAQRLGDLVGAERTLLFLATPGGEFALHDPLLTLGDRESDAASSFADCELARAVTGSGRPAVVARARADARVPEAFSAGLAVDNLLTVPMGPPGGADALLVFVNKATAEGFIEDDAGLAQFLATLTPTAAADELGRRGGARTAVEASLAVLPQVTGDGIVVVDQSGVVMACNASAAERLDLLDDPLGRPAAEALGNDELAALIGRALGTDRRFEADWPGPDGSQVAHGRISLSPLCDGETPIGALVVLPVSAVVAPGDDLGQRLLAAVSHELRTPLTAIKACASTLLRVELIDKAARDGFLAEMATQADRLADSVDELIDSAESTVREMLAALQRTIPDRSAEAEFPDPEPVVRVPIADALRAVRLLLRDALLRSCRDSVVKVEAKEEDEDTVVLAISFVMDPQLEEAAGVSALPFATASAGPRPGGGLGLGLYLAGRVARKWGGCVLASREDDGRVRWAIRFPVDQDTTNSLAPPRR